MKVTLLRLDGLEEAMLAASCCVSSEMPTEPRSEALMAAVRSGHLSVLEHAVATFSIEGISRACSHQLVRHRLASYSQQSQRYVVQYPFKYVTPETIEEDEATDDLYIQAMMAIEGAYAELIALGIPEEDARYILPNACCTNMVVTMDLRELSHACGLRRCSRAQWEIRELFDAMAEQVVREMMGQMDIRAPRDEEDHRDVVALIDLFQPQCVQRHGCPEEKGCGWYANLGEGERRWSTMPCRIPPTTPQDAPTSRRTSSGTGD